jgi:hypothetical protein
VVVVVVEERGDGGIARWRKTERTGIMYVYSSSEFFTYSLASLVELKLPNTNLDSF